MPLQSYTLLTIGDGLVAQIPALVISTAAGVIVTRVGTHQDVGQQMVDQLFNKPQVMQLSTGVLGLLGLVPGVPNLVFLLFTALLLGLAWWLKGPAGCAVASPALRPLSPPPADAVVTSVSWHIESERPLPSGVRLAICLGGGVYFPMVWPDTAWRRRGSPPVIRRCCG